MFGLTITKQTTLDAANEEIVEAKRVIAKLEEDVAVGLRRLKDAEEQQRVLHITHAERIDEANKILKHIREESNAAVEEARNEAAALRAIVRREADARARADAELDRILALYNTSQAEVANLKAERERLETTIRRNADSFENITRTLVDENTKLKERNARV